MRRSFLFCGLLFTCLMFAVAGAQTAFIVAKEPTPRYVYQILPDQIMSAVLVRADVRTGEIRFHCSDDTIDRCARIKTDEKSIIDSFKGKEWLTESEYSHIGVVGIDFTRLSNIQDTLESIESNTKPQRQ